MLQLWVNTKWELLLRQCSILSLAIFSNTPWAVRSVRSGGRSQEGSCSLDDRPSTLRRWTEPTCANWRVEHCEQSAAPAAAAAAAEMQCTSRDLSHNWRHISAGQRRRRRCLCGSIFTVVVVVVAVVAKQQSLFS